MRICSLVPGATEVVVMLGLADSLVGISHECDYPSAVRRVPVMVQPAVESDGMDSAEIDRRVKVLRSSGQALYRVDERALAEARPDIILTQDLCHVCAITPPELERAIQSLPRRPKLLTLGPASLHDVIDDVERIGAALGVTSRGRDLAHSLRGRIASICDGPTRRSRPRVVCLEWLNPLYVGGHWVPDMVDAAGGLDVLGHAGEPSHRITIEEMHAAAPDILVVMPCGFSLPRTVSELTVLCRREPGFLVSTAKIYVVDAGSYFSRPGPRLVDGLELMAGICAGTVSGSNAVRELTGAFD